MIIDPRPMSLVSWVQAVSFSLRQYGLIPTMVGDRWKEWGKQVIQLPSIQKFQIADPRPFQDWREWAIYFNNTVAY